MTAPYEIVVLDVGGANLAIPFQRAGQADPDQVGGLSRAYAGNQYSSIVAEFMVVPLVSARASSAIFAQVKAMFAKGAQVPCQAGSAGNVFEGDTSVITCTGKVTGEMVPGGIDSSGKPLWIINLTLTVADSPDTVIAAGGSVYLSWVASPDKPGANLATADAAEDPFSISPSSIASVRILDAATPATCGGSPDPSVNCPITYTNPASPEFVWWTAATLLDGYLSGEPTVGMLSKGGTYDRWQAQETMAKIYCVRGGVDVATWTTGYSATNGGFAGSAITMVAPSAIVFPSLTGDRFRIELFGRLGLHGGYADDQPAVLARQNVSFGNGGAGSHLAFLSIGGLAALLNP